MLRMIYGRVSMSVALISQLAVLLIAIPIGAARLLRRLGRYPADRIVDIFYAIPSCCWRS
jgi:ABC-type dipeptide/oligopeptide/nickel transport system permease subunit